MPGDESWRRRRRRCSEAATLRMTLSCTINLEKWYQGKEDDREREHRCGLTASTAPVSFAGTAPHPWRSRCRGGPCSQRRRTMKIVIIGGSGLIGSKLATTLRGLGHEGVAASPDSGGNTPTGGGLAEAPEGGGGGGGVCPPPPFLKTGGGALFLAPPPHPP